VAEVVGRDGVYLGSFYRPANHPAIGLRPGQVVGRHVKDVRLSTRLIESPACLITDAFGITPALARMYRASGQAVPVGKRFLELNPKHPLVTGLQQVHKDRGDDSHVQRLDETAELLTAQPFLSEATYPRTRQISPDCSRTVWPAP
jgi:HSP90 family molecular chaperone